MGEVKDGVGGIDIQLFVLCGLRIPGVTFFDLFHLFLALPLRFGGPLYTLLMGLSTILFIPFCLPVMVFI